MFSWLTIIRTPVSGGGHTRQVFWNIELFGKVFSFDITNKLYIEDILLLEKQDDSTSF